MLLRKPLLCSHAAIPAQLIMNLIAFTQQTAMTFIALPTELENTNCQNDVNQPQDRINTTSANQETQNHENSVLETNNLSKLQEQLLLVTSSKTTDESAAVFTRCCIIPKVEVLLYFEHAVQDFRLTSTSSEASTTWFCISQLSSCVDTFCVVLLNGEH